MTAKSAARASIQREIRLESKKAKNAPYIKNLAKEETGRRIISDDGTTLRVLITYTDGTTREIAKIGGIWV